MDIDPNIVQGGTNALAVTIIVAVMKNLKGFIRLSQTQWKKETSTHLVSIDNAVLDLKDESSKRRIDFDELKKSVLSSLAKMESHVEELMKVLPVIAALKGFIETNNKRHVGNETEIIKLAEEVRLIRDKINKS